MRTPMSPKSLLGLSIELRMYCTRGGPERDQKKPSPLVIQTKKTKTTKDDPVSSLRRLHVKRVHHVA